MNPIRSSALLIAGLACLFTGCRSGKVLREDFSELQRIEIPEAGISFLVPGDRSTLKSQSSHTISAYLNPVDEYPALGQDARFMMQLLFTRETAIPKEPYHLDHTRVVTGPEAPWADVKRVTQCQSGEYWYTKISVGRYSIDGHEYFEEDIEIARRILESVECIPIESTSGGTAAP
jgi:hypothetical protein